ncbi:hypothetical protein ACHAPC_001908 [Botrytis cinerea]|uniref:Putative histidine acid protein n=1 Tax=Botryotinia fuckeliana (strain BcDW1) TaxID=1290391 RepID=M7UAZ0_BOTF1|nr:putative histidine acid protein [Botrytis cinerea BcDW1]
MVPITWSSIVYTYYGEITPTMINVTSPVLTPLGASQLYNSGSVIRDRYLNSTSTQLTLGLPVNGLSDQYIVNNQLQVWSTSDEYIVGSAQAFMQGLYPPVTGVQGVDSTSPNSNSMMASTDEFYLSLANTFFAGIDSSLLNYGNAINLYYYALYQYNHNSSIYDMTNSFGLLETLNGFASEQAISFNTPSTGSSIQYIAGQTFASKIIQQFQQTISSSGVSDKLSLYFGSYEPMLAFFYLSSLSTSDLTRRRFSRLPEYGSMMAFELFSYVEEGQSNSSNSFPEATELWVRFLFRNGTSDTNPLISYPLFNLGNSEIDIKYNDFVAEIGKFAINDLNAWCSSCGSISLFCAAILSNEPSNSASNNTKTFGSKGVNGVVGGIIGAVVTLVVVMLIASILAIFGFRMHRHDKTISNSAGGVGIAKRGSSASGGGFKGPEKLASDTDLNIVKGPGVGATTRHERVGSWEMGNASSNNANSAEGAGLRQERVVSTADYSRRSEDGIGNHNPWGKGVQSEDYV